MKNKPKNELVKKAEEEERRAEWLTKFREAERIRMQTGKIVRVEPLADYRKSKAKSGQRS